MTWARENEAWKGLERFLDDFSDFKEIPAEAYKLWEHYLVFGILFGNAKKILKMLPVILQDERAAVPVWYAGFGQAGFLAGGGLAERDRQYRAHGHGHPDRPAPRRPTILPEGAEASAAEEEAAGAAAEEGPG